MRLLLGVTGSIAAYKSYDLLRLLLKAGHTVRVITTKGAERFLRPELFSHLGAEFTYTWDQDFKQTGILHIELAKWADVLAIAPLSANTESRLANAACDDLLTSVALAFTGPRYFFPAMNTHMLHHPLRQINAQKLGLVGHVFQTADGLLACGDEGEGKLLPLESIADLIEIGISHHLPTNTNKEKKVLITTGASVAPLDPVRYLTNSSSGLTGYYLAKAFLSAGYRVHVVAGLYATQKLNNFIPHPHFKCERASDVEHFYELVKKNLSKDSVFIASAALSDFHFHSRASKIKKTSLTSQLEITPSTDVLAEVIKGNLAHKIVGFAAETTFTQEQFLDKIQRKPVDLLVATEVDNGLISKTVPKGFYASKARYTILNRHGEILIDDQLSKAEMAKQIVTHVEHLS